MIGNSHTNSLFVPVDHVQSLGKLSATSICPCKVNKVNKGHPIPCRTLWLPPYQHALRNYHGNITTTLRLGS